MSGSAGFTAAGDHLVDLTTLGELGVKFPAEFARPAGACIEAIDDGWIDVFHGRRLLRRGENEFARFVRLGHSVLPRVIHRFLDDRSLYYKAMTCTSPSWRVLISCSLDGSILQESGNPIMACCEVPGFRVVISGMIRALNNVVLQNRTLETV